MRVGRVVSVDEFPEARVPAWKLEIDFGAEIGVKRSSAQITNYERAELEGTLVVAVVNFPPKQIGPFISEVPGARRPRRRARRRPAAPGPRGRARRPDRLSAQPGSPAFGELGIRHWSVGRPR